MRYFQQMQHQLCKSILFPIEYIILTNQIKLRSTIFFYHSLSLQFKKICFKTNVSILQINFINQFLSQNMKSILYLLVLSVVIYAGSCQLNIDRVKIVDSNKKLKNYLVRGNLPIDINKKFQMKQLRTHLKNITGLSDFKLIVVSFMNFLTAKQTRNRYIEQKYFEKHPNKGQYRSELILGSLIDPNSFPYPVAKSLLLISQIFDIDQIDELITNLHKQLRKGKKKIIFIHCSAGMDRTGYVAGSYKIKYLNYTLKKVLQENSKFGGHRKVMHMPFLNGLKWFCFSNKDKSICK